jgi:GNAT superfamily N-acetyltransferase
MTAGIVVRPATRSRWKDLETLFGPNGAYSGCWCMFFRQTSAEFSASAGEPNRRRMKAIVERNEVPGLIAYLDKQPVGWVSVAPRKEFGRVERSPLFKSDEVEPGVWSIVCFFVHRSHRGTGVASALVEAAVDHAIKKGARVIEGYPYDPAHKNRWNAAEAYIGTIDMFKGCGFEVVRRTKPGRPLMQYRVGAAP